jgi:Chitinase class I/ROS/MUCR transcriptional regulator protein
VTPEIALHIEKFRVLKMAIDRIAFFDRMRPLFGGRYQNSQVAGLNAIMDAWESKTPNGDLRWLAYMMATAFHETARTMQPVREAFWLSEQWRKTHLRYYPYYGRGYVQLTWQANYAKAGAYVGADLVASPDLALRPDYAAVIMQVGMSEGWFRRDRHGRPHTLARYFGHGVDDSVGAREIINGPEWTRVGGQKVLLATVIARYHAEFLAALSGQVPVAVASPELAPEVPENFGALAASMPLDDGLYASAAAGDLAFLASVASAAPDGGHPDILPLTASIATGYVSNNALAIEELPKLISTIHATLHRLTADAMPEAEPSDPAARTSPDPGSPIEPSVATPRSRGRGKASQGVETREA